MDETKMACVHVESIQIRGLLQSSIIFLWKSSMTREQYNIFMKK
jgi:hypothetical protein